MFSSRLAMRRVNRCWGGDELRGFLDVGHSHGHRWARPSARECRASLPDRTHRRHTVAIINYITQVQLDFGAVKLLPQECERIGILRPLVVTDAGVRAAGVLDKALAA